MIGKNLLKTLAVTGAAIALPVISTASTHYTGTMPAGIAMMATSTPATVVKASTHHKAKKVIHHAAVKKAALTKKIKHSLHKKHVALTAKKKHTA